MKTYSSSVLKTLPIISAVLPMIDYLKCGKLPEDKLQAKKLVMEHSQYDLIDNVLHHENPAN